MRLPTSEQVDRVLAYRGCFEEPDAPYCTSELDEFVNYTVWNSPPLEGLIQALYQNGFILREFDWCDWKEGLEHWTDKLWIASTSFTTLCKLFTAHVRNDRGAEGHLPLMCREGVVHAMLERLAELRENGECR